MSADPAEHALRGRLLAVAPVLAPGLSARELDELEVGPLLARLGAEVAADPASDRVWLLCVAVAGAFPTRAELQLALRGLRIAGPDEVIPAILSGVALSAAEAIGRTSELRLAVGEVVVDVDFCARHDHNTGIQRVVRQTMPHWAADHAVRLAAWHDGALGFRELSDRERLRVLDWPSRREARVREADTAAPSQLVVPWKSTVVLPEVPQRELIDRLATLATWSGNDLVAVGYDAIPIVSAHTTTPSESDRFALYLSIVKHATRIAGISESASGEFRGFVAALPSQGLTGPEVVSVSLPVALPSAPTGELPPPQPGSPTVLMVGSVEPRKNQAAVVFAAELLWREGLDFRVDIIGGGSTWYLRGFLAEIARLRRAGHDIAVRTGVDDLELRRAYRDAAFVVFPSLHEGYGLPVAEALAAGKPVLTSNYGSTAEIAKAGGCVLVDPRDDAAIAAAMRELLTDAALRERLVAETRLRTDRDWHDYARELWQALVVGTKGAA